MGGLTRGNAARVLERALDAAGSLSTLSERGRIVPGQRSIVVSGLRFFFHTTLKGERIAFTIPSPRQSGRLPVVLSRDEVERLSG